MGLNPSLCSLCICLLTSALGAVEASRLLELPPEQRVQAVHHLLTDSPRVRWSADQVDLVTTLEDLQLPRHRLLIRLGSDELRPRLRPALDGDWWEAVIALCTTYDLQLVDVAQSAVDSGPLVSTQRLDSGASSGVVVSAGPVVLAPDHGGRQRRQYSACGPVLLIVEDVVTTQLRQLDGERRWADLSYRLRLQPAAPQAIISEAEMRWQRASTGGRDLELSLERQPPSRLGLALAEDSQAGRSGHLRLGDLRSGDGLVQLEGSLVITARLPLTQLTSIGVGEALQTAFDGRPLQARLSPGTGLDHLDLTVEMPVTAGIEAPRISLFTASGIPMQSHDREVTTADGTHRWVLRYRGSALDHYRLRLSQLLELGREELPIHGELRLP